jgi:hypothetical protein
MDKSKEQKKYLIYYGVWSPNGLEEKCETLQVYHDPSPRILRKNLQTALDLKLGCSVEILFWKES